MTNLCVCMKAAGYDENFRLEKAKSAMNGFTKMVEVEREGERLINRPRSWEEDSRQIKKDSKQKNWFRAGGHHVPVFVPHTPGSELARRMPAKEEENNQGRKTRFLIIELGGKKIHNLLWTPDPWHEAKCGNSASFPCKGDKGGDCRRQRVTYNLFCATCQGYRSLQVKVAAYPGETGRNMFDRGKEHLA